MAALGRSARSVSLLPCSPAMASLCSLSAGARLAVIAALSLLLESLLDSCSPWLHLAAAAAVYVATGGHHTLYLAWNTLPRDIRYGEREREREPPVSSRGTWTFVSLRGAYRYLRLLSVVYFYQKWNVTVPQAFRKTAERHGGRACLVYEGQTWTFRDLHAYSNRVAHYLLGEGYKPGDCLALFMHNRPVGTFNRGFPDRNEGEAFSYSMPGRRSRCSFV